MLTKRSRGFHAPLSLVQDAGSYVEAMRSYGGATKGKKGGPEAIPGNTAAILDHLEAEAKRVAPYAAAIVDLESRLSAAYDAYDKAAVALWREFSEARNFARLYAENHGLKDVESIAKRFMYHASRTAHRTSPSPDRPTDDATAPAKP